MHNEAAKTAGVAQAFPGTRSRTVSNEPSEPAPDFLIPMTKLHLEPAPTPTSASIAAPAMQPTVVDQLPVAAIPMVLEHHGALALLLAGLGSVLGLLISLMGGFVGWLLNIGIFGALPGMVVGMAAGAAAWGLAQVDLGKMARGWMDPAGRSLSVRGRWVGALSCAGWALVFYTVLVFQIGYLVGNAASD
jgi:hypothetical protein